MPTGLKETDFERASQDLAAAFVHALECFCANWGTSPPPLSQDAFVDLAGDVLTSQPSILAGVLRATTTIAA